MSATPEINMPLSTIQIQQQQLPTLLVEGGPTARQGRRRSSLEQQRVKSLDAGTPRPNSAKVSLHLRVMSYPPVTSFHGKRQPEVPRMVSIEPLPIAPAVVPIAPNKRRYRILGCIACTAVVSLATGIGLIFTSEAQSKKYLAGGILMAIGGLGLSGSCVGALHYALSEMSA